jgi:archaellum component FlaC
MAKIIINNKEHTCSQPIKEEIEFLRNRLETTFTALERLSDRFDEFSDATREASNKLGDELNSHIQYLRNFR